MRATLDVCFAALATIVSLAAVAVSFSGLDLPLSLLYRGVPGF